MKRTTGKTKRPGRGKTDVQRYFESQMADPEFAAAYEAGLADLRIAVQIAELRERRGLSQSQLAARAHTSQAVVSRIESQQVLPELGTLARIASALHATLSVEITPTDRPVRRRRAA